MLERGGAPGFVRVTAAALGTEARCMSIVGAMTSFACARYLLLEVARAVALLALKVGVGAQQGEGRFARMIELRRLPAARVMATRACEATRPTVHIVDCMAGDALFGRSCEPIASVAGGAGCPSM